MNFHYRLLAVLALTLVSTVIVACQTATPAATPGTFTAADIVKLKWLEGTWRGTGEKQSPFFERYRFEGSTMIVEGFGADETMQKVQETSRFELHDGRFGHVEGTRESAASSITDTAVQFVPVRAIKYSFRFEKQNDGTWRAVIEWPAELNKPTIVYRMERWTPKK